VPSDAHKAVARISGPGKGLKGRFSSFSTTPRQSAAVSAGAARSSMGLSVRQNAGPVSASSTMQTLSAECRLRTCLERRLRA